MTKTICFFNSNKAWGGGEKWHFTTCKEFARQGYKTILVTNTASALKVRGTEERLNVYPFRVGNLSFLNPMKIFIFFLFFKLKKVDSVVMNLPADLKVAGIAAKLAGVKNIIYRRGMPHPLRSTALNRFLFTKVLTHVIVNSKEIGRSLAEGNESWFPKDKLVLVYNGVDSSRPIDQESRLIQKENDEIILGNAGRLTEQKGQKYLIEMAKILKNEGLKFKLYIAGEGELKSSLQEQINKENLQNEVKLMGHVSDMPGFFNSLDVFIFTSLYEGSANTLIETLQYGVPTLAWNVSSNPEIIIDGMTGLLAELGNTKELADKTKILLGERAKEYIKNGHDLVRERFDSSQNLSKLSQIIKE